MINVNPEIISFIDIPQKSANAVRSVLLLRHSFRESLQNGSLDPGLTEDGWNYAEKCGKLLKGMKDLSFGASPRQRTFQTVQAIIKGGELAGESCSIPAYSQICDTVMFDSPEKLAELINDGVLAQTLREYYSAGSAPGMIGLDKFVSELVEFLTGNAFETPNVILATHDIVLVALLSRFNVYPFQQDDWCGYVQGAFLSQEKNGEWTIQYVVPDKENRERYQFFI